MDTRLLKLLYATGCAQNSIRVVPGNLGFHSATFKRKLWTALPHGGLHWGNGHLFAHNIWGDQAHNINFPQFKAAGHFKKGRPISDTTFGGVGHNFLPPTRFGLNYGGRSPPTTFGGHTLTFVKSPPRCVRKMSA